MRYIVICIKELDIFNILIIIVFVYKYKMNFVNYCKMECLIILIKI